MESIDIPTVFKTSGKIIFFEEMRVYLFPFLIWYIVKGCQIQIFQCSPRFTSLIRDEILSGQITIVNWNAIDHQLRHRVDGDAIRELELRYKAWFNKPPLRRILVSLYGTEDAETAIKKSVVIQLKKIFQLALAANLHAKAHECSSDQVFIPGRSFQSFRDIGFFCTICTCTIPGYARFFHTCSYLVAKTKSVLLLAVYPAWLLIQIVLPAGETPGNKQYLLGARIYDTDLAFYQKYRSIDFLIDNNFIQPSDVLFLIDTPIDRNYRNKLTERQYATLDVREILRSSRKETIRSIPLMIKNWLPALFYAITENPFAIRVFVEALHIHIIWTRILKEYSFSHYVVYNDTSPSQILRNILLQKKGIVTWYYVHSCGTVNYFSQLHEPEIPHVIFSYLYYDRFVTWNAKVQRYYESHPNVIQKFEGFGCLWSEAIRDIRRRQGTDPRLQTLIRKWIGNSSENTLKNRIIAVFDSTFGGEATLTGQHMILFIDGILTLLEKNSQVTVVFKMKYSKNQMMQYHPPVLEPMVQTAYQNLENHPRCILLDDDISEAAEVIAVSDLVISACFTSPTIEALGAGIKGIYFDADGKSRGTYYDQFPNLVAHDPDELCHIVDFWLNRVTDDEFTLFIKKYVLKEIDWYADGKAVERFRNAIARKDRF
jgi:polysaccharide biosynthesis PFTS motif protein